MSNTDMSKNLLYYALIKPITYVHKICQKQMYMTVKTSHFRVFEKYSNVT